MSKVISKDGTSIAYEKAGNGPTVIVVDGALCSRAFGPTSKLVPLIQDQFSVITYDRRGRNESGDTLPYSVEREIEDLDAIIKEVGDSVYMVGFSSGAALILNASAKGLNIKKMILYEAPYVMNQGGYNPPADSEAQLKALIKADKRSDAVKFFMKDMVGMPGIMASVMSILPVWSKLKGVAHTLPYDAAILNGFSLPVNLAKTVNTPALVMGGEKSPVTLRNAVLKLAEALPNAKNKLLEGQNHNVSMKAIAPEIINYFKN
ncbi:MAG TPA: alpha/beta hydrolase [Bacteroidia bacterium]|jgi:pimeloyl-ACP methyl ester carboxylesterase|nr:alpha/beta hydrolase [Bacteroidia bacterium]